jgi:hypothetical protein
MNYSIVIKKQQGNILLQLISCLDNQIAANHLKYTKHNWAVISEFTFKTVFISLNFILPHQRELIMLIEK